MPDFDNTGKQFSPTALHFNHISALFRSLLVNADERRPSSPNRYPSCSASVSAGRASAVVERWHWSECVRDCVHWWLGSTLFMKVIPSDFTVRRSPPGLTLACWRGTQRLYHELIIAGRDPGHTPLSRVKTDLRSPSESVRVACVLARRKLELYCMTPSHVTKSRFRTSAMLE